MASGHTEPKQDKSGTRRREAEDGEASDGDADKHVAKVSLEVQKPIDLRSTYTWTS